MSLRRTHLPSRKAVSILGAAVLLFAVASNSQAGWVFVLSAAVFGVFGAGMVLPHRALKAISVVRRAPGVCRAGDPVRVSVELRNRSRSSKFLIEGVDEFLGHSPFLVEHLANRGIATAEYEVTPARRGVYHRADVVISSGAPFGVRRAYRRLPVDSHIIVHPKWAKLSSFPLLESASTPDEVVHERRRGSGMEFYGIREYRSGDSLRHVHWRSSARAGRLFVREFEEHFASRLGILIDSQEKIGAEPHTTFEEAVASAASLAVYALGAGHPVQLFADSLSGTQHLFEPGRREALDWLAGIEAEGRRGLGRIAMDMAGEIYRRSTNVLIFPATRRNAEEAVAAAATLQARSSRVIAVIICASEYSSSDRRALDPAGEEALAERLAGDHVVVYRVGPRRDIAECSKEPSRV